MADNETIADIIAEKRRRANEIEHDCAEKMKRGELVSDRYARELVADIRREADRLEAAWKRERAIHAMTCKANERLREHLEIAIENDKRASVGNAAQTTEKSSVVGNAAALREALVAIQKLVQANIAADEFDDLEPLKEYVQIRDICNAALAAPPRQCDVGTAEEQYRRWVHFCEQRLHRCDNCPCNRPEGCTFTFENMPYEPKEGGAK